MNPVSVIMALLLLPAVAAQDVVISQVYYDAVDESGSEAVELHNRGNVTANISGWLLVTETSAADATIPAHTVLGPQQHYLIADSGWSLERDDLNWPLADHEEAITLANANAGVALSNGSAIVDAVGWGDAAGIGKALFEGTPHPGTTEGNALLRRNETDNNAADFVVVTPAFRNRIANSAAALIAISVSVGGAAPIILNVSAGEDEDAFKEGVQVLPVPKQNRTIAIEAYVADQNGNGDIVDVMARIGGLSVALQPRIAVDATTRVYTQNVSLAYYAPPGTYAVNVTATDSAGLNASLAASLEYLSLASFEADTVAVAFNALPGEVIEREGDAAAGAGNATLWNTGNVPLNFLVWGGDLSAAGASIPAGQVEYRFGSAYEPLQHAARHHDVNLAPGGTMPLSFRLAVPASTRPGNYTGSLYLSAVGP